MVNRQRIQIGSTVNPNLWTQIQELSKETRIPISRLLDEAMEDLLKKYEK